jgi:hypothetical protein
MNINLALHRDQRLLAIAKLGKLNGDHPLREKYREWIRQLDERIGRGEVVYGVEEFADVVSSKTVAMDPELSSITGDGDTRRGVDRSTTRPARRVEGEPDSTRPGMASAQTKKVRVGHKPKKTLCELDLRQTKIAEKEELIAQNQLLRRMLERFE